MQFQFVDKLPAVVKGGNRNYRDPLVEAFADALRASPGQWATWPKNISSERAAAALAHRINTGSGSAPKALHGGAFEATSRSGVVYVRYREGEK